MTDANHLYILKNQTQILYVYHKECYVLFCLSSHSGLSYTGRSLAACELLYNAGYKNLFWVQGGLEAAEEEVFVMSGPGTLMLLILWYYIMFFLLFMIINRYPFLSYLCSVNQTWIWEYNEFHLVWSRILSEKVLYLLNLLELVGFQSFLGNNLIFLFCLFFLLILRSIIKGKWIDWNFSLYFFIQMEI